MSTVTSITIDEVIKEILRDFCVKKGIFRLSTPKHVELKITVDVFFRNLSKILIFTSL